jgi:hypothetical protein
MTPDGLAHVGSPNLSSLYSNRRVCREKARQSQPVKVRPKEVSVYLGSYPGGGRVGEGCALDAVLNSHVDIVGAANALDLLLDPTRCTATLRF